MDRGREARPLEGGVHRRREPRGGELRLRHDVEEPPRGQEPGAQRLLVAAALVGHDHGPDPVRDELQHGVVARLAHRERGAREMGAELRAMRLHDDGGAALAGRETARLPGRAPRAPASGR